MLRSHVWGFAARGRQFPPEHWYVRNSVIRERQFGGPRRIEVQFVWIQSGVFFSEKDFRGVKFYFSTDMYHTSKLASDMIRQRIEKNELRIESWNSPAAAKGRPGALEIRPLEMGLVEF